jgi:hypothetical protein
MTRITFVAFQALVFITTLFVALDSYLQGELSLWLVHALPIRLALILGQVGLPGAGDGGGAVCPLTCQRGPLLWASSLVAVALSARHLLRQWTPSTPRVPSAFGPIERLLAQVGLGLMTLSIALSASVVLNANFGAVGSAMLALFISAVTFGWMMSPARLAQVLLALAFWIVEIKWLIAAWRARRSPAAG